VKLADGKERTIQHMTATTFWSADGTPMSAAQFLESLFGALPEFFKDEDELRNLERPDTRKALLAGLADKGFGREPLAEMQKAIEAENSDLFDVLAYVAFASAPQTREARATAARVATAQQFTDRQQRVRGLRAGAVRRAGRGRTRCREAVAAAEAEVPQRLAGCLRGTRAAGADPRRVRGVSEASVMI
jgi:hypothetical protein